MWGGSTYPKYRLFVIGFTAVLVGLLWWILEGTRLGSAVRAGSESSEMVSLLGINVTRIFSLVFALGAATAALAGVLVGGLLVGIVQSVMSTLWPEGARLMDLCGHGGGAAAPERFARESRMNFNSRPEALETSTSTKSFGASMHRYRFLLLAALVVCLLPTAIRSGSLATEVLVYALAVLGCNLLLGHTGLLSFGQGIFFGLGSYAAGLMLTKGGSQVPLALLVAIAIGALAAALVGWFSIRQRGAYFVMLTLAFGQMFYFFAYTTPDLTGGDNGLLDIPRPALSIFDTSLFPIATPWQYYAFVAVLFLIAFWLMLRVSHSVFGRTLLAIRDNEARGCRGLRRAPLQVARLRDFGRRHRPCRRLARVDDGYRPAFQHRHHTSEMILVMTVIGGTGNLFSSVLDTAFYVLFADWLCSRPCGRDGCFCLDSCSSQ